jgi:hypothetical protein
VHTTFKLTARHPKILFEVIWRRDELKRAQPFFFAATVNDRLLHTDFEARLTPITSPNSVLTVGFVSDFERCTSS